MPSVEFMYRSYDPNGTVRATASRVVDTLQTAGHLGEVSESLYATILQQQGKNRMVLSVEEEPPVAVEYAELSKGLGVGQLTRGSVAAVVVILAAHARLVGPDLQALEERLAAAYPAADFSPMFQYLKQAQAPAATGFYVKEGPADVGVDTVAVALAGAVLRMHWEGKSEKPE